MLQSIDAIESKIYWTFHDHPWSLWFGSLEETTMEIGCFFKRTGRTRIGSVRTKLDLFLSLYVENGLVLIDFEENKLGRSWIWCVRPRCIVSCHIFDCFPTRHDYLPRAEAQFCQDLINRKSPFWWIESCISCARSDSFPLRKKTMHSDLGIHNRIYESFCPFSWYQLVLVPSTSRFF